MKPVESLENNLIRASQAYYSNGNSPLSDEKFDELSTQLKRYKPESDLFNIGWGYDVSLSSTAGEKIKHKYGVVGSLSKCRSFDELPKQLQNKEVDVSLKLDGISVVLYYENGILVNALTRGDGHIGIDITDKIEYVNKNLFNANISTGAIRGELVMSYKAFQEYKIKHPEAKNPRNTVAGIINSKEIQKDINLIDLLVYKIIYIDGETPKNMIENRELLKDIFGCANTAPYESITTTSKKFIPGMDELKSKWYGTYPADGIVITSSTPMPNGNIFDYEAVAYKFPSEVKETTVKSVEWNMSKSQYLIPKIKIEPVELSGTTVAFCTGFNAKYIKDNNIGKGTIIKITKSGEIIPHVVEILKPTLADLPIDCPECGTTFVSDGVHLKCPNRECLNLKVKDTLIWFTSLVDTDGISEKLIIKFLNAYVKTGLIADISIESIMQNTKIMPSLVASAQLSKFNNQMRQLITGKFEYTQALRALNIPRLGEITSKKLSNYPDLIGKLLNDIKQHFTITEPNFNRLTSVVGVATADSIRDNIGKFQRLLLLNDRLVDTQPKNATQVMSVALTGKMSMSRKEIERLANAKNIIVKDITKETKYLVTNDPNSNSAKNRKADKLGIAKINESQFLNMLK